MSIFKRLEKSLDQRLRSIFSGGEDDDPGAREAIELYRDALEQITNRATPGKRGERIFPFDLITIELMAETPERKAVLETLFEPGQLLDDIRAALREDDITPPPGLAVSVTYPQGAIIEMRVVCERIGKSGKPTAEVATPLELPPARLITLTGVSSAPDFTLDRPRILIGRSEEITDSLGRTVRRNDLVFSDYADEANGSVSRAHAHIQLDPEGKSWRIYDDGSSIGTTIFRDGHRIDVPAHAGRGVALRPGDEIYLGQARLRFESAG